MQRHGSATRSFRLEPDPESPAHGWARPDQSQFDIRRPKGTAGSAIRSMKSPSDNRRKNKNEHENSAHANTLNLVAGRLHLQTRRAYQPVDTRATTITAPSILMLRSPCHQDRRSAILMLPA
jgi:hypothetical protein